MRKLFSGEQTTYECNYICIYECVLGLRELALTSLKSIYTCILYNINLDLKN
jgi:hypothetical protein